MRGGRLPSHDQIDEPFICDEVLKDRSFLKCISSLWDDFVSYHGFLQVGISVDSREVICNTSGFTLSFSIPTGSSVEDNGVLYISSSTYPFINGYNLLYP